MEIKPKRPKLSSPSSGNQSAPVPSNANIAKRESESESMKEKGQQPLPESHKKQPSSGESQEAEGKVNKTDNPAGGLLGLAYDASSDDEE